MLTISHDYTWSAKRGEHLIPKDSSVFEGVLGMLQSVKDVLSLLECLDHCKLCTVGIMMRNFWNLLHGVKENLWISQVT